MDRDSVSDGTGGGLRAGRQALTAVERGTQVLVRVHRGCSDPDFVVQVGTGAASAQADVAQNLATVEGALTIERINALAKGSGNASLDRPKGRRLGHPDPIRHGETGTRSHA